MTALSAQEKIGKPPEILSAAQRVRLESNDGKGSLILRIKRKRGTDAVSALRIESLLANGIDPSQVEDHARRLEGGASSSPEDRMSAAIPAKRRLTERGIFRLADTVSASTFANEASTKKLEKRITELKNALPPASVKHFESEERTTFKEDASPAPVLKEATKAALEEPLRFKIVKPEINKTKGAVESLRSKGSSSSLRSRAMHAKFKRSASKGSISSLRKSSDASVQTRKLTSSSRLRFIDAVMERSNSAVKQKGRKADLSKNTGKGVTKSSNTDAEMDLLDKRFADLLGNYLKENDLEAPRDLYDSSVVTDSVQQADSSEEEDSEEDYVYDIYFREKEPMWGSGLAGASDAGLMPAEVAGREEIGSTYKVPAESQYTVEPMATLVGFSDEDDLITEMENASILMGQEIQGDSEDEFDEGEDEDSNDEGFYRNDYPEDEGGEEDEMNQAGWGWSGPRRRGQRYSSDEDDGRGDSEDSGSNIHD